MAKVNLMGQVIDGIHKYCVGTIYFVDARRLSQNCMSISINVRGALVKLHLLHTFEIFIWNINYVVWRALDPSSPEYAKYRNLKSDLSNLIRKQLFDGHCQSRNSYTLCCHQILPKASHFFHWKGDAPL